MLNFIFLQATGAEWQGPLLILGMFIIFWLFFIRPQSQKAKQEQVFINDLEKGMEVATKSGIIGKINKIEDNIITLQVDTKTFIRMTRGAVSKEMTDALTNDETDKK